MKKTIKVFALLMAAFLCLVLTGCQKEETKPETITNTPAEITTTNAPDVKISSTIGNGDRTIVHIESDYNGNTEYVNALLAGDDCLYAMIWGDKQIVRVYPLDGGAPVDYTIDGNDYRDYTLKELYSIDDTAEEGEGEEYTSSYSIDEEERFNNIAWFSWNGSLYVVQYTYNNGPDDSGEGTIDGGYVKKAVLADGKCTLEETTDIPRLDWSNMVMDYGDWKDTKYLNNAFVSGDTLIGSSWDPNGALLLEMFDLKTGYQKEEELDSEAELFSNGSGILLSRTEWNNDSVTYRVSWMDPSDLSEQALCEFTLNESYVYNMFADMEKNTLYYIMNGEIWAAPDMKMDAAKAVCDCPVNGTMFMLKDGRMLIWDNSSILIRNVDPATRGTETKVIVQDYGYGDGLDEAVFEYNNIRGDVTVVLKRGGDSSTILQAMMNRESEEDIYTLDYNSSEFTAMLNRGYLPDLSGNADIAARAERMYPFLKDALVKDGKIIGIPVALNGSAIGINMTIWKEIGGTEEELPKTWNQFLDWVETLPAKVKDQNCGIFDSYETGEDFVLNCMVNILYQYEARLDSAGNDFTFNTPELRDLLERLVNMDTEALGLGSRQDMEDGYYDDSDYKEPLVNMYGSSVMRPWYNNFNVQPLLLSFADGEDAILPVELTVAFVNPYSQHADIAAEYLAVTAGKQYQYMQYNMFTDMTEPLRNSYYEENHERYEKYLAEAKELMEEAKDEDELQRWTEVYKEYEEALKDMEENDWSISPDTLAGYQKRVPAMRVSAYNFIRDMVSDEESSEAFYEMVSGYAAKTVSAAKLLEEIDSKVQMMRLEGN